MSTNVPGQDIVNAIEAGFTQVTRRLEIYEADGQTLWHPNGSEEDLFRLIGGNVTVDNSRDERRAADFVLDNADNGMRPNPDGGFWYDKILKPYRGVKYRTPEGGPRILIIESVDLPYAKFLKNMFISLGFRYVDINLNASTLSDLNGYQVIFSHGTEYGATTKAALLKSAFFHGYNIFTTSSLNTPAEVPHLLTVQGIYAPEASYITPPSTDNSFSGGWTTQEQATYYTWAPKTIHPNAQVAATSASAQVGEWISASGYEEGGARWFDFHHALIQWGSGAVLASKGLNWLWNYSSWREWETPLGEFVIDNMKTANWPKSISVATRDKTKLCLGSKIEKNMAFDSGTSVHELITALATNAGITKIRLNPAEDDVLGARIDAARTDPRWKIMSDAAAYLNLKLFFDLDGYLTTEPFADPATGAPVVIFKTGNDGNLTNYDHSTSDARIYNHIIVTGTSSTSEETGLEFFGEAVNDNPSSPTRRSLLGDRSYFYTSSFFTSDAQCQTYADKLLKQTALEQYEVNFNSIVYPWLDAGVVTEFMDPDALPQEPTRFLMDTMSIPLSLSAMPATGKRVLFVEADVPVPAAQEDTDAESTEG